MFGKISIRNLAEKLALSKSSVQRHQRARLKRAQHPESAFWETEAGADFLARTVFAALYQFGLKNHIGAEQLSEFFRMIRIDTHVGVSPNAVLIRMRQMETLLPTFQSQCEQSATCPTPKRTLTMDEVFFDKMMMLVLMDLTSGYILVEEQADDRSYETWHKKAAARLKTLNIEVKHAISDRAKALIKLAIDGFGCNAGADLFHAQYDLSRWFPAPLARATKKAVQVLKETKNVLDKHLAHASADAIETSLLQTQVEQASTHHTTLEQAHTRYRQHQQAISFAVHLFDKTTAKPNSGETVRAALHVEVNALGALAQTLKISDTHDAVGKFKRQINDLGSHVEVWWLWVNSLLTDADTDQSIQHWVKHQLMPVIYWHHQRQKTQKAGQREQYQKAWEQASLHLAQASLTSQLSSSEQHYWQLWCEDKVKHFHRASSAVEGRNGCLAQMYHNGRGLTPSRMMALTVIHNYGIYRIDGSTAASRLFETSFPNLFEWLLPQMGELPLPRKRRVKIKHNPLMLLDVPL